MRLQLSGLSPWALKDLEVQIELFHIYYGVTVFWAVGYQATLNSFANFSCLISTVVEAVQAGGSMNQAMQQLLTQSRSNPTDPTNNNTSSPGLTLTNDALEGFGEDHMSDDNDVGGPSVSHIEQRDAEMEDEITNEIAKGDGLSDYDIEVTKEGEAINEYLALLDSVGSSERASSSQ